MNYFRNFASVPPPPVMPPPVFHGFQPVIQHHTSYSTVLRPTTVAATAPPFQTTNPRPIGGVSLKMESCAGDRLAFPPPLQHPTHSAKCQPDATHVANGSRVCNDTNSSAPTISRDLAPEVARVQRELVDWKAANLSATSTLDGICRSRIPDTDSCRRQSTWLPKSSWNHTDKSGKDAVCVGHQHDEKSSKQTGSNTNDEAIDAATGRLSLHSVPESNGTSSLSPADSGWMSDASLGRTSRESGCSSNESGASREAISCPASPLSSKGDLYDAVDGRPTSDDRNDECCVDDVSTTKVSSALIKENLDRCCQLMNGTGKVAPSKRIQVAMSVGDINADGDDESDSLSTLPTIDLDVENTKSPTPADLDIGSQVAVPATASSTRPGRPMKSIPVRFHRLLEAEVERVAAVRRRVFGSPLYAAAVAIAPVANSMQDVPQMVDSGLQNLANETAWTTVPVIGMSDYTGSLNLYNQQASSSSVGYQLHYTTAPMQYGTIAPASSSYYLSPAQFMPVNESVPTATALQKPPPVGAIEYQAGYYNGCYMQPYYYNACPDGVTPTYIVQVDSSQSRPPSSMTESKPNLQSSLATMNEYQIKDKSTSSKTASFVPAGIAYVVGSNPGNTLYVATGSSVQESNSFEGVPGGSVMAGPPPAAAAAGSYVHQPWFSTNPCGVNTTMTPSDAEYFGAVHIQHQHHTSAGVY